MKLSEDESRELIDIINLHVKRFCATCDVCEDCKKRSECSTWSIKKKAKSSVYGIRARKYFHKKT